MDLGRIDWMPKKKVWKAIGYIGVRNIVIGYYQTRDEAIEALRKWNNLI